MDWDHLAWPFFEERHRGLAAAFAELGRRGWLDHTLPPVEAAGLPDLRSICVLRECCAYGSAIADLSLSEPWLGALPVCLAGSPDQKHRYLSGYARGLLLPAFALSEPDAGSDLSAIGATARLDGDCYVLNGRKTWTSNAGLADIYVVFARMMEGTAAGSISAFIVEAADGGIVLEERLKVLSPHTVGTWRLENCRIPAGRLLGEP